VILPDIAPAFSQLSTTVSCEVRDVDNDGYADIISTATDAYGGPQVGVTIEVTPDGSPRSLYNGSTDSGGQLVFEDMPPGNYTWSSSVGIVGSVSINSSDYPIEVSERVAFWLWFMAFKSNATDGEKGRYLLQAIANYARYSEPLPPKGSSNNETAKLLMPWM